MFFKKLLQVCVVILFVFTFTACEQEGPMERAGEKIDETIEETAEGVEEAGETIEEKAEEAREKMEEKTQ